MAFEIEISPIAILDITDYAAYIQLKEGSVEPARKWRAGLLELIWSLAENPLRFRRVPELADSHPSLRQVIYHSHRVIYEVISDGAKVTIVRVIHQRREQLEISNLSPESGDRPVDDSP